MNDYILDLINNNEWDKAILESKDIFSKIFEGKNIFHYACIRGNKNVILTALNLKSISILISDHNGNTGAHLLALNGWDKLLLEVIEFEPIFLKLKNNHDKFVYNYVIQRNDTFFKIIKAMSKSSYLQYLNFVRQNNKTLLIDILEQCDNIQSKNFIKIKFLSDYNINWNIPEDNLPFIMLLKQQKEDICNFILDNVKTLKINAINYDELNLLQASLEFNMKNIAIKLIDMGSDINFGGPENIYIPLSTCFKTKQFDVSQKLINNPAINYNEKDNQLNTPIYYLLYQIGNNKTLLEQKKIFKITEKVIKNSDLANVNRINVTPLHIITMFKLWNTFRNVLEQKQFDLNILDNKKKSVLHYLSDEEIFDFMKIVDKQIRNNNIVDIKKHINIIMPKISKIEFTSGLFNADGIHNTIYMMYILTKYKNCIIPMRYPIDDKMAWEINKFKIEMFPRDKVSHFITSVVSFYSETFYSILPCMIFWRNIKLNFKTKNFLMYLTRSINTNYRFVILKLTLVPSTIILHANIVIYDKQRNIITRFEPYGDWNILDSIYLDKMLFNAFKKALPNNKLKSLKYIRPTQYLSETRFQSSSLDNYNMERNFGDPAGFCLAWCYWFVELKMLNPDIDEKILVKSALNEIIINAKNTDTNPLLNYIRKYAKHLDDEKNKIFEKININETDYYKINPSNDTFNNIEKYVTDYVIDKLLSN